MIHLYRGGDARPGITEDRSGPLPAEKGNTGVRIPFGSSHLKLQQQGEPG